MLDQANNFSLISLSINVTCLLDNVWIFYGETSESLRVQSRILSLKQLCLFLWRHEDMFWNKLKEKEKGNNESHFSFFSSFFFFGSRVDLNFGHFSSIDLKVNFPHYLP